MVSLLFWRTPISTYTITHIFDVFLSSFAKYKAVKYPNAISKINAE